MEERATVLVPALQHAGEVFGRERLGAGGEEGRGSSGEEKEALIWHFSRRSRCNRASQASEMTRSRVAGINKALICKDIIEKQCVTSAKKHKSKMRSPRACTLK